jgi:hypothetical protein|tara:strand:+ start:141 stop:491 length:351 start_codon:yes stop_codon:yes gene_type:complete
MSREILKLKPEVIKPGLNVLVNWDHYKGGENFYPGEVIKKLRKNWRVKVYRDQGEYQNVSVPYEAMTINTGFTKEGRRLMATKEDKQIFFSKEHIDYVQSLLVIPENKKINHAEIK